MGLCVRAAEGRPSCSVCAIQPDRPSSSAMAMVDFSGVRDAIRVGQVSEALKDVASIRSLGGKNAKASGPCGVVCTGLLSVESLNDVAPTCCCGFTCLAEPIPQGLYEELLLRSANRHRLAWLQVCREALELYLVDAAQLGLHPSAKVLKTVLEVSSREQGDRESGRRAC